LLKIIQRARKFSERNAIISSGKKYSYKNLLNVSSVIAGNLLGDKYDLDEARVAFMVNPGFEYVATQWGIWKAGGIAVPLCLSHPLPALQQTIEDSGSQIVIVGSEFYAILETLEDILDLKMISLDNLSSSRLLLLPNINPDRPAMILYTSGTTSKPKGVVTTHANIEEQITSLINAWEWSEEDHILNILPLHHVHGIINVISCALWSGAICEFLPKFSSEMVWSRIIDGHLTLFMAVPTIYHKLIKHWENASETEQASMSANCKKLRLMVSGSAALPLSILNQWKKITGQILLERYGMTEIGMGLSNPYREKRHPGFVGKPLPGVEIKLMDESGEEVKPGTSGEIYIKGKGVFLEYWNDPTATDNAFSGEWFKSGDIAVVENGYYKILGRQSIDIIKSGSYKISALEIEDVLRAYPGIDECAVIGIPSTEWGEIVAACLIVGKGKLDFKELREWLKEKLPVYKVPKEFIILDDLPRNSLGKVTKNKLITFFNIS